MITIEGTQEMVDRWQEHLAQNSLPDTIIKQSALSHFETVMA